MITLGYGIYRRGQLVATVVGSKEDALEIAREIQNEQVIILECSRESSLREAIEGESDEN